MKADRKVGEPNREVICAPQLRFGRALFFGFLFLRRLLLSSFFRSFLCRYLLRCLFLGRLFGGLFLGAFLLCASKNVVPVIGVLFVGSYAENRHVSESECE